MEKKMETTIISHKLILGLYGGYIGNVGASLVQDDATIIYFHGNR